MHYGSQGASTESWNDHCLLQVTEDGLYKRGKDWGNPNVWEKQLQTSTADIQKGHQFHTTLLHTWYTSSKKLGLWTTSHIVVAQKLLPMKDHQTVLLPSFTRSTRHLTAAYGISRSTIVWILHTAHCHLFMIQMQQQLSEDDPVRHVEFCTWDLDQHQQDPSFAQGILLSGNAIFC